jgi:hypothetical protein
MRNECGPSPTLPKISLYLQDMAYIYTIQIMESPPNVAELQVDVLPYPDMDFDYSFFYIYNKQHTAQSQSLLLYKYSLLI